MPNFCDLDRVRAMLGIPAGDQRDDALLTQLCGFACALFERKTDRHYEQRSHTEYFDVREAQNRLVLKHYPVISWAGLTRVDDGEAYGEDEIQVKSDSGIVVLLDGTFPKGPAKLVFTWAAGYTSVPEEIMQACELQAASWYNNVKTRGFKREKLDTHSYEALGELEPEFEIAALVHEKKGRKIF